MSSRFDLHVDSLDVSEAFVVVGLSNLDGNIWDGGLKLLSLENGSEIQSKHCECGVSMVRFVGQNKNFVLSARDDGNVALYASSTMDELLRMPAHDDYVSCVAVDDSNETEYVSCGWDGNIKIWDWQVESKNIPVLNIQHAHHKHVNEVSISSLQNSLMASVGQDGFLRIWDRRTDINSMGCVQLFNHNQAVSCVTWDAHSQHNLYTGTDAGDVSAFDIRVSHSGGDSGSGTSSVESYYSTRHRTHNGRVRRLRTLQGHAGTVVSCSDDTTIAVLDIKQQPQQLDLESFDIGVNQR